MIMTIDNKNNNNDNNNNNNYKNSTIIWKEKYMV